MFRKIKEQTKEMNRKEKVSYVVTYYWYHMLGIAVLVGLLLFILIHFAFPKTETVFSLAIVNQQIDYERDEEIENAFSDESDIDTDQIVIDSDYNISYPGYELDDTNEGSFDKFFIKWANGEIDAIIATADFLEYCVSVGAEFYSVDSFQLADLSTYEQDGISGINITKSSISETLNTDEDLILVFPSVAEHESVCQKFIDYIRQEDI